MDSARTFGGFELHGKLGSGGMATVYRGLQKSLNRPVVLKILHPHLSEDASLVARFEREAHAAANLRHENIVQVIDCGRQDDTSYIAMEFVEGLDLKQLRERKGPPPLDIALLLVRDICRGLRHAHEHGVVHRDIKPANVMLTTDGLVKIMDFGLARRGEDSVGMTATGAVMGTPAYMSPEQAKGLVVDARSDLFSLGVMAYEMCAGSRPFPGDSYTGVLHEILTLDPARADVVNPAVPAEVADLVASLLRKDRDERCPTAAQALDLLETLVERRGLIRGRDLLRAYAATAASAGEGAGPGSDATRPGDTAAPAGVSTGGTTQGDPHATVAGPGAVVTPAQPPADRGDLATRVEAGGTEPAAGRPEGVGTGTPETPRTGSSAAGRPATPPADERRPGSGAGAAPSRGKPPVLLLAGGALGVLVAVVIAVLVTRPKTPDAPALPAQHEDAGPLFAGADSSESAGGETGDAAGGSTPADRDRADSGSRPPADTETSGGTPETGTTGGRPRPAGDSRPAGGTGTGTGSARPAGGTDPGTGTAVPAPPKPAASRKYQISTKPFGYVYLDGGAEPINPDGRPVQKSLGVGRHTFRAVNDQLGIDITCTYSVESTDRNNKLVLNLKTGQVEAGNSPDLPF